MYPIFALWVRSHRDLPLNVYQIVNTFRYETKTTRPFLRVREIHFFEEHTCQVDEAAATARVRSNLDAFGKMARSFALPFVAVRRPEWDKFPGAFYSVALDIPIGGAKTLQIGSVHHYRENFSRPYEIAYETTDGAQRFVHQTTFGLSERLIGAIVAVHGDSKGAIFPTEIAPYQVVIVPILSGETRESVLAFSESVEARLFEGRPSGLPRPFGGAAGGQVLPLGDPGRAAPSRDRGPGGRRRYGDGGEPPRREAAARSGVARGGGPIGARGVRPGALRACPERLPKLVQPRDEPRRARELGHRPDPPMVREGSVRARDRDRDRRGPARDPGRGSSRSRYRPSGLASSAGRPAEPSGSSPAGRCDGSGSLGGFRRLRRTQNANTTAATAATARPIATSASTFEDVGLKAGATVIASVAVARPPTESVSVITTENVPAELGVQVSGGAATDAQPSGRPVKAKDQGSVPPPGVASMVIG